MPPGPGGISCTVVSQSMIVHVHSQIETVAAMLTQVACSIGDVLCIVKCRLSQAQIQTRYSNSQAKQLILVRARMS